MSKLDYESKEKEQLLENTKILRGKLEQGVIDAKLQKKIKSYCKTNELEEQLITYAIKHDDLACIPFAVQPMRQGFHQSLALAHLKTFSGVKNLIGLPSSGPGSLYIFNGMVLTHKQVQNTNTIGKSIDFRWDFIDVHGELTECYATHKYTKQGGGNQDNQFKDVQSFVAQAKAHAGKQFFFAICDGAYYRKTYAGHTDRIRYLNSAHTGARCQALTIDDLEQYMLTNLSSK